MTDDAELARQLADLQEQMEWLTGAYFMHGEWLSVHNDYLDGLSGVHTHMTNSMNTPVEALEHAYPIRLLRYSLRPKSGGRGKFRGGDGVIREIRFLTKAQVTLLSDRRKFAPYGLNGGESGAPGSNTLTRSGGRKEEMPSKFTTWVQPGDILSIQTPGGGGWGKA